MENTSKQFEEKNTCTDIIYYLDFLYGGIFRSVSINMERLDNIIQIGTSSC